MRVLAQDGGVYHDKKCAAVECNGWLWDVLACKGYGSMSTLR